MPRRLVAGDKERIERTMRILEQDVARLEKSLAERRSREGQEATRQAILVKRAQIHRLNSYVQTAIPSQVVARRKPIPSSYVQPPIPPKGSVLLEERMEEARKQLKGEAAKPSVQDIAVETDAKLTPLPQVVDEKSLQKYNEVLEENKKIIHEMQLRIEALERQKELDLKPSVVEVPKPPSLSPTEKQDLIDLPKQLKHLNDRLVIVQKNVNRANEDGFMRLMLARHKRYNDPMSASEFTKRNLSLKIWLEMNETKEKTTVRRNQFRTVVQALTHPDITNIPQKMTSIKNRLKFLEEKKAGVNTGLAGHRSAPRKSSGFMDRVVANGHKAAQMEQLGAIQHRKSLMGVPNPHRPYAMGRNLGVLTVHKQRQLQRNNRPAIESNNMAGLRRYTAAQYARESRAKAEQEKAKSTANLAGAFSQTRAVMERMVR